VEDAAGVSAGSGGRGRNDRKGLLDAILSRLARPEIVEGALGDLEERLPRMAAGPGVRSGPSSSRT
jgi:hypothetical protein